MPGHRFPLPWLIKERPACFIVRDHDKQAPACAYFEDASPAGNYPSSCSRADEARRWLPTLLSSQWCQTTS